MSHMTKKVLNREELRCSSCDWTGEVEEEKVLELAKEHCFTCPGHMVRSYQKGEKKPTATTVFHREGSDSEFQVQFGNGGAEDVTYRKQ